ncbi:DUF2927 domain-containing protein [Limibaculum sp. M0105]|uniref:DUF2927 domain-containing protein n=1 Tax=Thermohalobaculum xanthum TaxID=2753746 RepID=A0A8J7M3J3_9RHOB|nr:DUF2927 domain-containing protein [Thermohalobaculum xanthum]MBK0397631.1 DUF2927 domain-containing protein [Thermohalobaculum xanthum]
MSRRAALALALWAALASCAAQPPYRAVPAPQVPVLGADIPAGTTAWSNASLARVFTALAFDMETGATRPGLMRLEQPVEVALEGPGSGQYAEFLDDYLHGLGSQTGIAIGRGVEGARSRIRLRLVEARSFARSEPSAACVLTPGASSWGAFRRGGPAGGSEAVTVFIPASAPPHVIRGCIAEEVAQALGLANDIYGLGPSIFNDDAAHVRPTALDLLMLRVLYAPELAPGMDRDAAEAAAERALDRLNPAGRDAPALVFMPDTALGEWRGIAVRVTSRDATPVTRAERARRRDPGRAPRTANAPALPEPDGAGTGEDPACARRGGRDAVRGPATLRPGAWASRYPSRPAAAGRGRSTSGRRPARRCADGERGDRSPAGRACA